MNPECALYNSLHITSVRMGKKCINPSVRLGSQSCQHFTGKLNNDFKNSQDITESCRRAIACRGAPPVETYLSEVD